jgi:lipoprotein Spr
MHRNDPIACRARALVGTRFRPHGRGDGEGVDCVGLVAVALGRDDVPRDYALRGGDAGALAVELASAGLQAAEDMRAGDVVVMRSGPGQLHLGVWSGTGLVHADAGLRRVVERPGEVPWPVVGVWRSLDCASRPRSTLRSR